MIVKKAYDGKKLVYRAYLNGRVIWDHGVCSAAQLIAALSGQATPKVETPESIQMHTVGTMDAAGMPRVRAFDAVIAKTEGTLEAKAMPRQAEAVHSAGVASGALQAIGAAATYGLVYTRGQSVNELAAQAFSHPVEALHPAGVADGELGGSLHPTTETALDLLMTGSGEVDGYALPTKQAPETVLMSSQGQMTATAFAETIPVYTVTIMCGDKVLYQERVAEGFSCSDPVESGAIDTPTQEMDEQYTYAYSGYSLTDGGEADAEALENITEDTVIYAAFEKSLRYYTVNLYDDDGSFLSTEQVAYGDMPTYAPTKDDYVFKAWSPAEVVTGDTSYYATWLNKVGFATGTWAEIAAIAETGRASECFSLGDTRVININGTNITFFIAGFNHDDLADGSGKAGMTILSKTGTGDTVASGVEYNGKYSGSKMDSKALSYFSVLDSDLQSVIKSVKKEVDNSVGCAVGSAAKTTIDRKIWIPSVTEIAATYTSSYATIQSLGVVYAGLNKYTITKTDCWLRNLNYKQSAYTRYMYYGTSSGARSQYSTTTQYGILLGFCI